MKVLFPSKRSAVSRYPFAALSVRLLSCGAITISVLLLLLHVLAGPVIYSGGVSVSSSSSIAPSFKASKPALKDKNAGGQNITSTLEQHNSQQQSPHLALIDSIARPFQVYKKQGGDYSSHDWCVEEEKDQQQGKGILLAKTFKTGSSTAATVTVRIAQQVAKRKQPRFAQDCCPVQYQHEDSLENRFASRQQPSVLWTVIRKPDRRAISAYFFYQVGVNRKQHSLNNNDNKDMIQYLQASKNNQVAQLRMNRTSLRESSGLLREKQTRLSPGKRLVGIDTESAARIIQTEIMDRYDFIAVSDRMDESLVVLKLLWGLEDGDILYLSSKVAGGWSWDWRRGNACFQIPRAETSDAVDDYLRGNFTRDNADFLLYEAVNRSLDLTIKELGAERVQNELKRHLELHEFVVKYCMDKVAFPCSRDGVWQDKAKEDCYNRDMGCGNRCIDEALEAASLLQKH